MSTRKPTRYSAKDIVPPLGLKHVGGRKNKMQYGHVRKGLGNEPISDAPTGHVVRSQPNNSFAHNQTNPSSLFLPNLQMSQSLDSYLPRWMRKRTRSAPNRPSLEPFTP